MDYQKRSAKGKDCHLMNTGLGNRRFALLGLSVVFLGLGAGACASPGTPPGAPPRSEPPMLIRSIPDSGATGVDIRHGVVQFDAVVSERPASSQARELRELFLISPVHGDIDVDWRRSQLRFRPKNGWKRNTTYSVTIAPGLSDLQGNSTDSTIHLLFSTGPEIDQGWVTGTVWDWANGSAASGAVVEVVPASDTTLAYIAFADQDGRFAIRAPQGLTGTVRASINRLGDRRFDNRMPLDSVSLKLTDSMDVELLAFEHDSIGPAIGTVRIEDSITLAISVTGYLDPTIELNTANFSVISEKDSSLVPLISVSKERPLDSVNIPDSLEVADTLAVKDTLEVTDTLEGKDTLPAARGMSKPPLYREFYLRLAIPLQAEEEYRITAKDLVNPNGAKGTSERKFTVPKPSPAEPPKENGESE